MAKINPFPQHNFITEQFFEDILKNQYPNDLIKVENLDLMAPLAKGENFSSDIIRATISYKKNENALNTVSYIVKAVVSDEHAEILDKYDVFHREIMFYRKVLPVVESLLLSIGDKTKIAPK